jgi:hypothetical protein
MFRAWELSPGAYYTLPMRDPTTIRTVFMGADDNLAKSIRQRQNSRLIEKLCSQLVSVQTIVVVALR